MERQLRDYAYYKTTRGMCRKCRNIVNARIIERDNRIFQENLCPECGNNASLIAEDKKWYFEHINHQLYSTPPKVTHTPSTSGCPYDCGLCSWHETAPNLPVFSITNACNLNCPICFTHNRKDVKYNMPVSEMKRTVEFLMENREEYDLINITGGEPTLHPELLDILGAAKHERIGRITLNSNGIRLAEDISLVKELKALGVYIIMSFNTLKRKTSKIIHGIDMVDTKIRALENLATHGVGVTLLNVMIKAVNDQEIYDIIQLSKAYPNIRSVTIQNMTFTGQGGSEFKPRKRLTLDMAIDMIETQSNGEIKKDHFFPLPSNHPLCYSIGYFFKLDNQLVSFTDLLSVSELKKLIGPNYIIRPDDQFHDKMKHAIAKSWANHRNEKLLFHIRKLLKRMYPKDKSLTSFERQRIAEESIITIYIHAHMDEDNFDVSRIVSCTDLVPVDGERLIPACAYNLFYRMKDERFFKPK